MCIVSFNAGVGNVGPGVPMSDEQSLAPTLKKKLTCL